MPKEGLKFKNLTNNEKIIIVQQLYSSSDGISIPKGTFQRVADEFSVFSSLEHDFPIITLQLFSRKKVWPAPFLQ
jgi:hypothetical protein